jgi:hypothetical protein
MGLDVYVGSLTRYYTGAWETVAQQWGRENGVPVTVLRPNECSDGHGSLWGRWFKQSAARTDENTRIAILGWRGQIARALGEQGRALDWDESATSPYFTDKPDWDGYGALLLLAAYDEHPERPRPTRVSKQWDEDPVLQACTGREMQSRYPHLYNVELWLPCPLDSIYQIQTPPGQPVLVGSSIQLLAHLRELNRRTYGGTSEEVASWRREWSPEDDAFDQTARCGLSIFTELAEKSVTYRLPLKLDY